MNFKKKIALFPAMMMFITSVHAQFTEANHDPDADFKLAKELFLQDKFSLAYPLFKTLYVLENERSNIPVTIQLEARYYSIVSGLHLMDETALSTAREFIKLEHNTPRKQMMSYHVGEYYFKKQDFAEALVYYELAGYDNFSNRDIATMKFHQGYAYFTLQDFNNAKPLFDAIRQIPDDQNYYDANYYYGFISLADKDHKEALSSFQVIESQPNYQKIIPYYITEIYYYTGQKDSSLSYGERALQSGSQYYDMQLRELLGHMYFEKGNYTKALPYLESYVTHTPKVSRETLYELSFCYYDAGNYSTAVNGFKELGGKQDTLAQNSMYLLADAYLKLDNKAGARNAFLFCALNSSNEQQKEISKFHYGKLSFELGYTDVSLNQLQEYIANYPRGLYFNEAKELLVNVLANTNNFKEALDLFKSLPAQTDIVKRIYPKILYGRATELMNDQKLDEANDLLNQLSIVSNNASYLPYTYFWKGEVAYRKGQFDSAVYFINVYLSNPVTFGEINSANARYILGYAYMRMDNYSAALQQFESVSSSLSNSATPLQADAFVRAADCYYMQKNFSKALQMYDQVISRKAASADYALYQKAIILGATDQYGQKVSILQSVAQQYPSSPLLADANMEIANTYLAQENYKAALTPLNALLKNTNAESVKPQIFLKLGISYYNLNDNTNALNSFKQLISEYPNSTESDEAVNYVRSIFMETQRPAEFVNFMKQNGKTVSYSEEDSLTYSAANLAYENRSFENAASGLSNYLTRFPDGQFAIDANYQLGVIYNNKKDFNNAIVYYKKVASKAPNKYAEASVLQAARISYFELNDYKQAEQLFEQLKNIAVSPENKLESMRGLLRCQYKLENWDAGVANAEDLLVQKGIATDDKMMANMVIAKNYQHNNADENALAAYKTVVSLGKSEFGAEARYRIAEIYFTQNKLSEAENASMEVINKAGSYPYWITKSYILLGDIFFRQKDYFNAEATLKSVVENATIPAFKQEAQQKLDIIITEKNKNSKIVQQ